MKKRHLYYLPFFTLFTYCSSGESKEIAVQEESIQMNKGESGNSDKWKNVNAAGKTVESRLPVPPGFQRVHASPNSIASFLRKLPVKPDGSPVLLYDGSEKQNQEPQTTVVDMEIGNKDLQQCADAVIRLRAEYFFKQKKFDDIHFNFTSGDRADYSKYAQGFRVSLNGDKVNWQKKVAPSNSYKTFRNYLDLVFTYAGTASLEKELQHVKSLYQIQVGDVLIQGGHPGHAVMVMDVAENPETGKRIYLIAQSYMPAQEIHLLKNPSQKNLSPWYSAEATGEISTPEWTFYSSQLKRFPNW